MKILIKGGRVINPATGLDGVKDIYIEDGYVRKIQDEITQDSSIHKVIEAKGLWVVPGLIDVHVHLREPGFEHKETIETGTLSALKGGFTTVCAMPNTKPVVDNKDVVNYIKAQAKEVASVNVLVVSAITKGQEGEELIDFDEMKNAGICAISEDGRSVMSSRLMKEAMILAKKHGLPILDHCEDESLAEGGCMNAGSVANRLGFKGIPDEAEEIITARDIMLAEKTGAKLHICHVSTKGSVEIIRDAKKKGIDVTAEVAPHHFTLSHEDVGDGNPNAKMNPPLRTKEDVEAMKQALKDGTLDMIATDHAPHHADEKNAGFEKAPNGIVGLETSVPLTITQLVIPGYLTPYQMVEKMSYNPAKMLGIDKGNIDVGSVADITLIDPNESYTIDINQFSSKSNNSPYHGMKVTGRVKGTIVGGEIRHLL